MDENNSSGRKPKRFFDGKGFYIALVACAAVIVASAWYLYRAGRTDVEAGAMQNELSAVTAAPGDDVLATPDTALGDDAPSETPAGDQTLDEQTATDETAAMDEGGSVETAAQPGWVWPVSGKVDVPYSVTALLYDKKLGDWRTHDGIDIAAKLGEKVCAAGAGTVESVARDDMNGETVVIAHTGGLRSVYANLADTPTVVKGDSVMQGETIGAVGATARGETKDAPHLLFKMTVDGQSVDPNKYLPGK